jgi:hypothetical protein
MNSHTTDVKEHCGQGLNPELPLRTYVTHVIVKTEQKYYESRPKNAERRSRGQYKRDSRYSL